MKIGILTLPLHTNYGGILQAYALQTVLQRMGHEVVLLDQTSRAYNPWWRFPLSLVERCFKKYFLRDKNVILFKEHKRNIEIPVIRQNTDRFINIHFPNRMMYRHIEKEVHPGMFDAIIVGSDQIWRPEYYRQISHAYLDFTQGWDIRRIAYAVSFGTEDWEYTPKETEVCKQLAQKFSGISVRENSAVRLCKEHLGRIPEWVLDPTLLLGPDNYLKLCSKQDRKSEREGQILVYILDETKDKQDFLKRITCLGFNAFHVNNPYSDDTKLSVSERIVPSLEQWLNGFSQAKYVFTDSFHGCVLSILFHKPFWVYANKERGLSRIKSLLSLFHMEDRIFNSSLEIHTSDHPFIPAINWTEVDRILSNMRQRSMDFLTKNLKGYV